ncbi:MAG: TMEM175 family protein [Solirubrobacteraceae bacterium]
MEPAREETRSLPAGAWVRGAGLEFDRVTFFTDAVFAIALTLLVLEIGVPGLAAGKHSSASALIDGLDDRIPEITSFAVAFILIGRYWLANHSFVAQLRAVDSRFMALSLVYLGFVAFLPFPTALVGEYEGNPISVVAFAVALGAVSGMETVLFAHARRHALMRVALPDDVYRWGLLASSTPVIIFVATLPLAFVDTTLTLVSWVVLAPLLQLLINRLRPAGMGEYFIGAA